MPDTRQILKTAAAVLLLNASLTFSNWWPTPAVWWNGAPSVELAVVLLGLVVALTMERGWRVAALDRLSGAEHARFTDLNTRYVARFGFPFIIAVKGLSKHEILHAFENRIHHGRQEEFETACHEVEKIARLRLEAMDFSGG